MQEHETYRIKINHSYDILLNVLKNIYWVLPKCLHSCYNHTCKMYNTTQHNRIHVVLCCFSEIENCMLYNIVQQCCVLCQKAILLYVVMCQNTPIFCKIPQNLPF